MIQQAIILHFVLRMDYYGSNVGTTILIIYRHYIKIEP